MSSIIFLWILFVNTIDKSEGNLILFETNDGESIENYDCFSIEPIRYCRRPDRSIRLKRNNDRTSCEMNGGEILSFNGIRSMNIDLNEMIEQGISNVDHLENYLSYLKNPLDETNTDFFCFCPNSKIFGKICEYTLPFGETFEETIEYQRLIRNDDFMEIESRENFICYETLKCDSGLLCLDWRDICDGIQQCSFGIDENHCDYLELNHCDETEYRCSNGMCIPNEYFLDGEFDCFDWSDEIHWKDNDLCPFESVSSTCDDHICPPNSWSCGDGQCIKERFRFQATDLYKTCFNQRNRFLTCENDRWILLWTQNDGFCSEYFGFRLEKSNLSRNVHQNNDELCQHLLRCSLTAGVSIYCSCSNRNECENDLKKFCHSKDIFYPPSGLFAPYLTTIYNRNRNSKKYSPDFLLINGTIRCQNSLITVENRRIRFPTDLNLKRLIEEEFCSNVKENSTRKCFNQNDSIDLCLEWNSCRSKTRIRDGFIDCLNEDDEKILSSEFVEKTCEENRKFRFLCSNDEPTCLNVMKIADGISDCRNDFDEFWLGKYRSLSEIGCNEKNSDECFLIRNYVEDSTKSLQTQMIDKIRGIPFRYYCDSFWHLGSGDDENLVECRNYWKCFDDLFQCSTGQCIPHDQINDFDFVWDCADGSDETLISSWVFDLFKVSKEIHIDWNQCHRDKSFICLKANSTERQWICLDREQIGDGQIDCLGAQDERHRLKHCSQTSHLGNYFYCSTTNSCLSNFDHCRNSSNRCPNLSDDHLWCSRSIDNSSINYCSGENDFICFNGQCQKESRCDKVFDCSQGEDEYMCDYQSVHARTFRSYRHGIFHYFDLIYRPLDLSPFPSDIQFISSSFSSSSIVEENSIKNLTFEEKSLSFECHRGVSIYLSSSSSNRSIVCFCPEQYYGDRCSFHSDRISFLFKLKFFSEYSLSTIEYQCFIYLIFDEKIILSYRTFSFRSQIDSNLTKKYLFTFVYRREIDLIEKRIKQNLSRSIVENEQHFSIRIEIYENQLRKKPSLIFLWIYPIFFDYLPNNRLAKILHLKRISIEENSCSSSPCRNPNELCYPLMNNLSRYICLCSEGFQGENCSKRNEFCRNSSSNSFCQSNLHFYSIDRPILISPMNSLTFQCDKNRCLNDGTCLISSSSIDQRICFCSKEFFGKFCEKRRSLIHFDLKDEIPFHFGSQIEYFQIESKSLTLKLIEQNVYRRISSSIDFYHWNFSSPLIVLMKLYSTIDVYHLYLLLNTNSNRNEYSINVKISFNEENLCFHLDDQTNPIRFHSFCQNRSSSRCFFNEIYFCLCRDDRQRVECFLFPSSSPQCSFCLNEGQCLKGQTNFLCLCPICHSGVQCQFSSRLFSFNFDQLFYSDLISSKSIRSILFLILFPSISFLFSIPNNFFSFLTFRQNESFRQFNGFSLLILSFVNQISVTFLLIRFIHLIIISQNSIENHFLNDFFCKILNFILIFSLRLSFWLITFVNLERTYSTIRIRGLFFKRRRIAFLFLFLICFIIFLSSFDEILFFKSFRTIENDNDRTICVMIYPEHLRRYMILFHQIFSILHFILPLILNISSTMIIISMLIKSKMNLRRKKYRKDEFSLEYQKINERQIFRSVLNENRDLLTRPMINLIPSIFSLFSLPFFIFIFSLSCQNLENHPLRYLLVTFYYLTYFPQCLTFILYIYPSTFFWTLWKKTSIGKRIDLFSSNAR